MPRLIITVGVSASGKTTWAKEFCKENDALAFSRDELRFDMFCGGEQNWDKYKYSKNKEELISHEQRDNVEKALKEGKKDVIIHDTNLNPNYWNKWEKLAKKYNYDFEKQLFPISLEEAWRRDMRRGGLAVGRDVIYGQWRRWLKIDPNHEKYSPNAGRPAIIVDVDGTLAKMNGRLPFEYNKVKDDIVIPHVANIVNAYRKAYPEHFIIILSGRENVATDNDCNVLQLTQKWLIDNLIAHDFIFLRAAGDRRKDTIVKKEIFLNKIAPMFDISFVIDDRPSVCRMWRDLGLDVVQVGDCHDEF